MKHGSKNFVATDRRALLLGAMGLSLLGAHGASAAQADVFSRVGTPTQAPDFSLEDADRKLWRLSALRDRVVVVNFWASWCPPCRKEMASLDSLYRTVAPKGALVLGINAGEPWEAVAAFSAAFDPALRFPLLIDEKGGVMRDWQVNALPSTYVIDRRGRIVLRALGGRDFSRPDAIEDITKLAAGG